MADLQQLKTLYLRLAKLKSVDPHGLPEQKKWLEETFLQRATEAEQGGFRATATNFTDGSLSGIWDGSTAEQRALALDLALKEIESAIEGKPITTGLTSLTPRFVSIPR